MARRGRAQKLISPRRGFRAHRRKRQERRQHQREIARQEGVKPQDHAPVINRGRRDWEARRIWQLKRKKTQRGRAFSISRAPWITATIRIRSG